MKGCEEIIARLNSRLSEELAGINQYIVHSEMCANWGYDRLHKAVEKRAIQEMKHAEKLIQRILFLEERPVVGPLGEVHIGSDVVGQYQTDLAAEEAAVKAYNDDVRVAAEMGDNGTRELLESILKDEEEHVDWLETQLDQIEQIGIQNYLAAQVE
ncbi:MAG: bacterioferritin [Armatimonadetes bacterium]|nr:bacterioferritin [Armatimonadota bacterium]